MKTLLTATSVFLFAGATVYAQKHVYTEASEFTLTGKIMETPDPYHRVDTVKYKGFTPTENQQVRNSSGIAVAFRTNSSSISIITKYGYTGFPDNTNGISARGYDLYIRHNGKWLFAAANVRPQTSLEKPLSLIKDMPAGEKDCLLYLPTYSEEHSVKIGIDENSVIEPLENPFRYRIAIFGSSYTHGSSTSRAGLTYPAQFSRETGIQLLSLGCSGNCKLQSYFADVLKDVQADAFIFDTFSNPSPDQIRERLFPFIENIQTAHPDVPLIFQSTIYREGRNFSKAADNRARVRMAVADSLMKIAVVKYKNVYYVHPDATSKRHDTTVDGVHPTNYGYTLWAESIEKPVLKILRKYGMK
ncbi:MAG: SGNH/GDSL hydrolase family protein [Bacteroidales bacterium]|nr:SGNH/GDSL hydrolase family protein [Bacteroidales bacterium]